MIEGTKEDKKEEKGEDEKHLVPPNLNESFGLIL
jgi:hypothetical protein